MALWNRTFLLSLSRGRYYGMKPGKPSSWVEKSDKVGVGRRGSSGVMAMMTSTIETVLLVTLMCFLQKTPSPRQLNAGVKVFLVGEGEVACERDSHVEGGHTKKRRVASSVAA